MSNIFSLHEPAIGEVFFRDGKNLKAKAASNTENPCKGCIYESQSLGDCIGIICNAEAREDEKNIIIVPTKEVNHAD